MVLLLLLFLSIYRYRLIVVHLFLCLYVLLSNLFHIFSRGAGSEGGITLEASKNPNRYSFHAHFLLFPYYE